MNLITAFNAVAAKVKAGHITATEQAVIFAVLQLMNERFWQGTVEVAEIKKRLNADIRTVTKAVQKLTDAGILFCYSTKVGIIDEGSKSEGKGKSGEPAQPNPKRGSKPVGKSLADFGKC